MKKLTATLLILMFVLCVEAQTNITWQKSIGGSSAETGKSIINTTDGGFIVLGTTQSVSGDGDITTNHGGKDLLVVKFDALKNVQWKKTYGGSADEDAAGIVQIGNSYSILSTTSSNDGDIISNHGQKDYWLLNINSVGTIISQQTFGGSGDDIAQSISKTKDGFAISGLSNSTDGDIISPIGGADVFVVQFDNSGIKQWSKSFGETSNDNYSKVMYNSNGALLYYINENNNDYTVSIDVNGNTISKTPSITGSSQYSNFNAIEYMGDSTYVYNFGIDQMDFIEVNSSMQQIWPEEFAFPQNSKLNITSLVADKTPYNHVFYAAGEKLGNLAVSYGYYDGINTITSESTYGGSAIDEANSIIKFGNTWLVLGTTSSTDGDIAFNNGSSDMWLIQRCTTNKPTITSVNPYFCHNDSLNLHFKPVGTSIYNWQLNGANINRANDTILNVKSAGNYSLLINENGCTAQSGIYSITEKSLPNQPVIAQKGHILSCTANNVVLSINRTNSKDNYVWSNTSTTDSISITNAGTYSVTITNEFGCSSLTNKVATVDGVPTPSICIVGIDSASRHNIIVWEKPICLAVDSFVVYKEGNIGGLYERIGAVNLHVYSTFIDTSSYPQAQEYRYKLTAKDTNGVETQLSSGHKTIHLAISVGVGGVYNLAWNNYEGFSYTTFNVYRGTTPFNMVKINSVSSNVFNYTDVNPPVGDVYYQIEIIGPYTCNPTARVNSFTSTRSNIAEHKITTGYVDLKASNQFVIYPNPTADEITIEASGTIEIYNVLGEKVLEKIVNRLAKIEVSGWNKGIYFVKIKNSQTSQKIIVH